MSSVCCGPPRSISITDAPSAVAPRSQLPIDERAMVRIDGATFAMGDASGDGSIADGEHPVHAVTLRAFWIDRACVSNAELAAFADATGYRTEAEQIGWSFVFHLFLPDDAPPTRAVAGAPWWRQVEGASWRCPEGPGSSIAERADHPAVHVSWNDAAAFARWAGCRLPTEAEWELAARGGLARARYPWGDELVPGGEHRCNIWQGEFPTRNTGDDGFVGTAPVASFPPNGNGLYNMVGNVWEWCADWFSPTYYAQSPPIDPIGPRTGSARVIRGGSYLCHASYCNRYRVAARSSNTPDSSTGHMGFRCARDA
jgi:formylglycine-generating enzyme required for sulfatase activity